MIDVNRIVVHCADTYAGMDVGAEEIRQWHLDRGWSDIGYHYVIRRNGRIEHGRDLDGDGDVLDEVGAHVLGYNQNSIGICLVGGRPDFNFTSSQMLALRGLLLKLALLFPRARLCGHRDLDANKSCPGFDVAAYFSPAPMLPL